MDTLNFWFQPPMVYFLIAGFVILLVFLSVMEGVSMRKITAAIASLAIFGLFIYTGIVIAHWAFDLF